MRKLTAAEVTFEVTIEAEDQPVRGNFASGDDELDRADEDAIIARLDRGDVEAWCGVVVKATWEFDGQTYEGVDSIWGCSLDDDYTAEAVAESHGMRDEALDRLNTELALACKRGSRLARKLRTTKAG